MFDIVVGVEDTGPVNFKIIKKVQINKTKVPKLRFVLRFIKTTMTIETSRGKIYLLGIERYLGQEQIYIPGIGISGAFRQTAEGVQLFRGRKCVKTTKQFCIQISSNYLMILPLEENTANL